MKPTSIKHYKFHIQKEHLKRKRVTKDRDNLHANELLIEVKEADSLTVLSRSVVTKYAGETDFEVILRKYRFTDYRDEKIKNGWNHERFTGYKSLEILNVTKADKQLIANVMANEEEAFTITEIADNFDGQLIPPSVNLLKAWNRVATRASNHIYSMVTNNSYRRQYNSYSNPTLYRFEREEAKSTLILYTHYLTNADVENLRLPGRAFGGLELPNAKRIARAFLDFSIPGVRYGIDEDMKDRHINLEYVTSIIAPKLEVISDKVMTNSSISTLDAPNLVRVGSKSLGGMKNRYSYIDSDKVESAQTFPKLVHIGDSSLGAFFTKELTLPVIEYVGKDSLCDSAYLRDGNSNNLTLAVYIVKGVRYEMKVVDGLAALEVGNPKTLIHQGREYEVKTLYGLEAVVNKTKEGKHFLAKFIADPSLLEEVEKFEVHDNGWYRKPDVEEFHKVEAHGSKLADAFTSCERKVDYLLSRYGMKTLAMKRAAAEIKKNKGFIPQDYQRITGACDYGTKQWMKNHPELDYTKPIKLKKVILALKPRDYGYQAFMKFVVDYEFMTQEKLDETLNPTPKATI